MKDFTLGSAYAGRPCQIAICTHTASANDEWGEQWTTDDEDNLYCADHNYLNPTSDDYEDDEADDRDFFRSEARWNEV